MAIKQKTQGTMLAAMVCVALSGGTALAATPDALHDEQLAAAASTQAPPLRWDSVLPVKKELAVEQAAAPQPIIITAADVKEQRKLEKAAEAKANRDAHAQLAAKQNAGAPAEDATARGEQAAAPAEPSPAKQEAVHNRRAEPLPPEQGMRPLYVPLTIAEEGQAKEAQPERAAVPAPFAPPSRAEVPGEAGPKEAPKAEPPRPAAPPQMPLPVAPGTKYALQPKQPAAPAAPAVFPPAMRADAQQAEERPFEFRNISERGYRHIQAGMFAMQHQLREAELEPATYKLVQLLQENDKLSRLDKIEYVIGICYAINHSSLSNWQKQSLIDLVATHFSTNG